MIEPDFEEVETQRTSGRCTGHTAFRPCSGLVYYVDSPLLVYTPTPLCESHLLVLASWLEKMRMQND